MFDSVSQAIQGILTHKLRSFLTMLGIIIGIASIITIISTIKGTNEQIKENLIGAGNNIVTVQLYQDDYAYDLTWNQAPSGVKVLEDSQRDELRKLDGVKDVSFFYSRNYAENVYYENTAFNGAVYGIDDTYLGINGYRIQSGRGFSKADYSTPRKNLLIDETAAKTLFGSENPIGRIMELKGEPFTVIGVIALESGFEPVINSVEDYNVYAQSNSGKILMPAGAWPIVYSFDEPQTVGLQTNSTDDMAAAGKAAADYLTEHQIAESVNKAGFSYRSNDLLKQAEQLQEMSSTTNNQLIWIASISLLVGGVGVMNIMLVTVTERTGEIGLKKAIGAKRRRILGQFLTEAAVLTGIGGLLGVLGGIGMSALISKFADTPTSLSLPAILFASIFSIFIGIIFGFFPAVKASKLNPIEALRRE